MKKRLLTMCATLILFLLPGSAQADVVFNLLMEFSGGSQPAGFPPWLIATFITLSPGTVEVRLQARLQSPSEFVNIWLFNLDPAFNPNNLSLAHVSGVPAAVTKGINAFRADGDGYFDIKFDWPQNPPASRFGNDDLVVYHITSAVHPIMETSFNFVSAPGGGQGMFPTAAHVQGVGPDGEESGWIAVPEPATLLTLGIGATFFMTRRRRRRSG